MVQQGGEGKEGGEGGLSLKQNLQFVLFSRISFLCWTVWWSALRDCACVGGVVTRSFSAILLSMTDHSPL